MAEIIYKELSYKIQGAFYKVYKALGNVHKEGVYHAALVEELEQSGLKVESQKKIDVYYSGKKVGVYVPDLVVEDLVIIELKCKPVLVRRLISPYLVSNRQGLARVSPLEGMSPVAVVISDVMKQFLSQIFFARKASSPEKIPGEEGKPYLNLVEPGSVEGKKMKDDPFVGFLKNALLFLLRHFPPAQAAHFGDQFSHFLRQMRLEIVHNQMNLLPGMFSYHPPQELTKFSGSVPLGRTPQELARMGVEGPKEIHRPVTDVTELPQEGFARQNGFIRTHPLERLDSRLLIHAEDGAPGWGLQVKPEHSKHLPLEIWISRIEPVSPLPGFQRRLLEPAVNRLGRNRADDSLADRFPPKLPVTPGLQRPSHLPGRRQDKLDKPVFGLRGKKRSELRDERGLLALLSSLSKSGPAISGLSSLASVAFGQSRHSRALERPEGSFLPLTHFDKPASALWQPFPERLSHPGSTRSVSASAPSLRSPRFLNEEDRPKPGKNLSNRVLGSVDI